MLIGVVGGGQLGRMLGMAGIPLGHRFRFLDPSPQAPAAAVGELIVGGYDDPDALARLVDGVDVVTYEFENVPVAAARLLGEAAPVLPPPEALEIGQDRMAEKALFERVGIPVAPYRSAAGPEEAKEAAQAIGCPAIVKTRRLGYDGKGQAVVRTPEEAADSWRSLGEVPVIVETMLEDVAECSILAARGGDGQTAFYPLVRNVHRDGILRLSTVPLEDADGLQPRAESFARAVMDALGYVGVLAIELFEADGLFANELAPRVHNSGHWTIEGAETSQFEQHLRAIAGQPLGSTAVRGYVAMVNVIGHEPDPAAVLAVPGAHLHSYGKAPREGRKLGHVTIRGDDPDTVTRAVERVRSVLG